uniref:Phorbol-ester/DAG-type domain-containing protein n=1 Tax=Syphacia muris TaxID=451379 RepID=A0A0N5ATW3_9BILA
MDEDKVKQFIQTYGRVHQIIMQVMFQEGVLLKDSFMKKFIEIVNSSASNEEDIILDNLKQNIMKEKEYIDLLLNVINGEIGRAKLRLVRLHDEFNEGLEGEQNEYVVLISLLQPNIVFSAVSEFNTEEKNLIMKWLEEICLNTDDGISEVDALNLAGEGVSKKRAEEMIDTLVISKFLEKVDSTTLNLGLRSIAELLPLLSEVSSWKDCASCVKPVLFENRAFRCNSCGSCVHRYCAYRLRNCDSEGLIRCPFKVDSGGLCGCILETSAHK